MKDKTIIIIRTKNGARYANFIEKEINLKGYKCVILEINQVINYIKTNKLTTKNTLIHTRTASPNKIYKTLKELEKKGFRVINKANTVRLTSDKYRLCEYSMKKGIPCAYTVKVKKTNAKKTAIEMLKKYKAIIMKPVVSQGQGVFCFKFTKINKTEEKKIKNIPGEEIVIQEYIEYTRLSRIIVVGFKAIFECIFYDEPNKKDWKCSVCLNPHIKHYKKPPFELLRLAEDIADKFESDICFIDIFSSKKGLVLNEINTACNLIIHEGISRHNVSKDIADYLISKIQ